jgi:hypothetical protein
MSVVVVALKAAQAQGPSVERHLPTVSASDATATG